MALGLLSDKYRRACKLANYAECHIERLSLNGHLVGIDQQKKHTWRKRNRSCAAGLPWEVQDEMIEAKLEMALPLTVAALSEERCRRTARQTVPQGAGRTVPWGWSGLFPPIWGSSFTDGVRVTVPISPASGDGCPPGDPADSCSRRNVQIKHHSDQVYVLVAVFA